MALPFFYITAFEPSQKEIVLDEETSKHIVQVLRMKEGEKLNLTDGKENLIIGEIKEAHKNHCIVRVEGTRHKPARAGTDGVQVTRKISIAISLLKNTNRFEWFLEKATEIGVSEIIPVICQRTEKEKFRFERMNSICISAMLQSQQCRLPVLHEPVEFENLIMKQFENCQKLIAHCYESEKGQVSNFQTFKFPNYLICIGPEGDFTKNEIDLALRNNFIPVSLGETRLRSETAGVVAAVLLKQG